MTMATAHRLPRASTAGLVVLLTVAVAACGSSSSPAASPGTPRSTSPVAVALSPTAVVERVALVESDFTDGSTVALINGGDQVAGQITLDNCGSLFTTEAHRVARRQIDIRAVKGKQPSFFSNEVVAYDTPEQAAKALAEVRASVTHCPKDVFVPSTVQGVPPQRYDVSRLSTLSNPPVQDSAVETLTLSAEGTTRQVHAVIIYQRRGTVLDILYLNSLKKLSASKVAAARSLAQITGK